MIGGFLMAIIGMLYLVFEDFVLSDFTTPKQLLPQKSGSAFGRVLVGTQVSATTSCFSAPS